MRTKKAAKRVGKRMTTVVLEGGLLLWLVLS